MHLRHYSVAGAVGALLLGCASFTPSLGPREWYVQGIVAGLSAAVGYGVGTFLVWVAHGVTGWRPPHHMVRTGWIVVTAVGVPLVGLSLWQGQRWQREIHVLTGVDPPDSYAWFPTLVLGLAVLLTVVGAMRGLRWVVHQVAVRLVRVVPQRLSGPLAAVIVVALLGGVNDGLILRGVVTAANSAFGAVNGTTDSWVSRPALPERSGSPASLVPWDSLGRRGREFVGTGPDLEDLAEFSGRPARQPVRVYVGLRSADSVRERAVLAVRELERAAAFDREVLVVATTTGTGFIDPAAVEAVEYLYNGDSAVVGLQYSYLPSWISLFVDGERAQEAGRELFDEVYDAWSDVPADDRPRLLLTGTSLGVIGAEGAFGGVADLLQRTDGVVWAGTPHFSSLHRRFVDERDDGSPEWLPVHDGGRTVRFVAEPGDVWSPGPGWTRPRIVYLQYGSDPVVRWSPRLAFARPDWLEEPPAPDVSPDMFWIPVVTFWQVTADLPAAYQVPDGHGHRYSELYADAWAAVARPTGWDDEDTERLRRELRENRLARERLSLGETGR